ncbi:12304_t:CDS:2, partial [Funneliformis geosporum]
SERMARKNKEERQIPFTIQHTGGVSVTAFQSNCYVDQHIGTFSIQIRNVSNNDNPCHEHQRTINIFSEWEDNTKTRILGSEIVQRQTRGLIYAGGEFHKVTDKGLLSQGHMDHFHEVYGISGVHPVFVDYSGMVIMMLDTCGVLYTWDEMEQNGNNLREGLANYLCYPEKVGSVIKNNPEFIPKEELFNRIKEKVAK